MARRHRRTAAVASIAPVRRQGVPYTRVSSKEQEKEGYSLDAQKKLWEEYAHGAHLPTVEPFNEAETAKERGRSRFDDMIALVLKAPEHHAILVEKTDRLYRNFYDFLTIDELVRQGLEVHFIKESFILTRTSRSHEKFIHGIKLLMAKNFIDNLSEETRKGLTEKAEQGMWPGQAPLGYRNVVRHDRSKEIEPCTTMGSIVAHLFEWFSSGHHTLDDAARKAKADGLRFRKSNEPVQRSTIYQMLRNPLYMGEFDWAGKRYNGTYEPLLSREVWERVQDVLDRAGQKKLRKAVHDFAFARLIECGHCGCAMVGEVKKGKYVYYHCTGGKARVHGTAKCPEPYTREEVLEEAFSKLLDGLAFDEEIIEWVRTALHESHDDEKRHHDNAIAALQAEYTKLQNRIDRMYDDKLDGRIDMAFFERKSAEWRAEQDRLLLNVREHQGANQTYLEEGLRVLELARRAAELFKTQAANEKRRLLDFLLSNCSWRDGKLTTTFRQPFDIIAGTVANDRAAQAGSQGSEDHSEIWLRLLDSNRHKSYDSSRLHVDSRTKDRTRVDVSARSVAPVGPSVERTQSAVATTSDEALKLAIKLAIDAGEYERAAALIDVAKRTAKPGSVTPIDSARDR